MCAALLALGLGTVQGVASASPPPGTSRGPATVTAIEDGTARSLAASLSDPAWQTRIEEAALASDGVGLGDLARKASSPAGKDFRSVVADADRDIAAAKGLGAEAGPLLRLRLADESMRKALEAGAEPLVAAAPADDSATTVTAYDSAGRTHTLDAHRLPERPVYVVGVDAERAVTAGMAVLREELARHGLSTTGPADSVSTASDGFWTSRITSVRLSDDEEPWIKGDAEIFSLVTGFGPDGKVRVDPVDMPYLDEDGRTYQPNQILVNWSYYKYNLADVVMMEEDTSTNYRSLAKALAGALLTIIDMGAYVPLVNAVLDAMPDDWWTDDPDYVDSWYTLARNSTGSFRGARGNGTMTLEPYWVSAF
ncbi:DUF3103 family protein [Streptomyces pini]|uniref:DUF3103 family protein n=1 Tax=Streptomyces pini TaxID=1520580 RepID=UPI001FE86023|nr:DUF3103 family protein [Streptomyces pini]